MPRNSDFHVSHAQILHLHVKLTVPMVHLVQQPAIPRSAPPSCWQNLCMNLHAQRILHIRGLCGASSGQKAFAVRTGEAHVCLSLLCVIACSDPHLYQQALAVCGI